MNITLSRDEVHQLNLFTKVIQVMDWDEYRVREMGFPDEVTLTEDQAVSVGFFVAMAAKYGDSS